MVKNLKSVKSDSGDKCVTTDVAVYDKSVGKSMALAPFHEQAPTDATDVLRVDGEQPEQTKTEQCEDDKGGDFPKQIMQRSEVSEPIELGVIESEAFTEVSQVIQPRGLRGDRKNELAKRDVQAHPYQRLLHVYMNLCWHVSDP